MRKEYIFMMIAGFFWGSGHPVIRSILTSSNPHMDSIQIAFLSTLISCFLLLVFVLMTKSLRIKIRRSRGWFLLSAVAGSLQFGLYPILSYTALSFIPSSTNAMIINAAPILVALLSIVMIKERLSFQGYFGILIAFIGITLLVQGLNISAPAGIFPGALFSLGGALITAIYSIIGRKLMKNHDPIIVSAIGAVFGALILLLISLFTYRINNLIWADLSHLYLVIYWAVAQALGSLLFFTAMRRLEAPRASVFMFISPLTATILSVIFLGEVITTQFLIGSLFVIIGIIISQRKAS
ncbi:MAG: DMT family transporter [Nitrososphaerota archaeon]